MANTIDYLLWRGDLPFSTVALCDVDLLVFSQMAYIPFDGVVPENFSSSVSLYEASDAVLEKASRYRGMDFFFWREDKTLIQLLGSCERFRNIRLTGYLNILSDEYEEQFAAVTAVLPNGNAVVAFRGTDISIVGWKEDFSMAVAESIPSQREAVRYVTRLAEGFPGKITLAGHSKGGNLAVYAYAFSPEHVRYGLSGAVNFDGPGFNEKIVGTEAVKNISREVKTILPNSSIIGMLLTHDEDFRIIESENTGIFQHDPYSWKISCSDFITVSEFTNSSQFIDATMKDWINSMPHEMREQLIDTLFTVLSSNDSKNIIDALFRHGLVPRLDKLDRESLKLFIEVTRRFNGAVTDNFRKYLSRLDQRQFFSRRPGKSLPSDSENFPKPQK